MTYVTSPEDHEGVKIPGYDYGSPGAAHSPVSIEELRQLEQTVGWTEADAHTLHRHIGLFRRYAQAMVDSWRAVIGSQPHLVKWFFGPDGRRDDEYATRIKPRFVQWVIDVATRPHDQAWLDYQEEIGLRHTPQKKNQTDHRQTPPLVPLRYLLAFIPQVTLGARQFFVNAGVSGKTCSNSKTHGPKPCTCISRSGRDGIQKRGCGEPRPSIKFKIENEPTF